MAKENRLGMADRFLLAVAPRAAVKRIAAKRTAALMVNSGYGNYGASVTKKSLLGWMFAGGSAKEDIEDNLDVLRQRSRDAYMGIPAAAAALKTMRTNVIAGGLIPAPQPDAELLGLSDEEAGEIQNQLMREFSLWADTRGCDADGMDNFYGLQQLAFISWLMNGDSIALLPMEEEPSDPYGLKVRLIEADRVCSPGLFDRLSPCNVDGHSVYRIVQGVETDETGRVIAYWVCDRHPRGGYESKPYRWTRVAAAGEMSGRRNVLHIMHRERAGQLRGVPLLSPVLESLKQLGRYTDAEINAAVISAMFTVFVQSQNASDARPFGEMIPEEKQVDAEDDRSMELAPGAIVGLQPGETVSFADPKHPNDGFSTFEHAMMRQIGAALEIPVEVMQKQFTTSYSAARGSLNEFWRTCTMYRDWFIDDFCQPVYEEWLAEAVARGRVNAPGFFDNPAIRKAWSCCTWNGPARTNLNPVQEVNAAVIRINAGISTAQEETAQMTGGDYDRNIRQRLLEAKKKRMVDEVAFLNEQTEQDGEE